MDWLSRLFEMMPVRGRLDLRCSYGAPWRIDQGPGEANEIPYHAVLAGSAMLDDPAGGRPLQLNGRRHPAASGQPAARHARRQRGRAAAGPQPRGPQLHDQRKSRFGRAARSVVRTLRRRPAARPPAAQLSAAASGRACRALRRTEGHGCATRGPRLADAERVRRRSSRRPRDAERAVDGDVRAGAAPRQRNRGRAARASCAGRSSAPGAGGGRAVQRARARMVAAGTRAPLPTCRVRRSPGNSRRSSDDRPAIS